MVLWESGEGLGASEYCLGGNNPVARQAGTGRNTAVLLIRQVKFIAEKYKCATVGKPASHWAGRPEMGSMGTQWGARCKKERCVGLASLGLGYKFSQHKQEPNSGYQKGD